MGTCVESLVVLIEILARSSDKLTSKNLNYTRNPLANRAEI